LAFIPEDKIADIRNAADIVAVISESVFLKKAGKDYIGLCPFHSEKTPSFTVSPEKQIFYCFGCHTGGNVFHFLVKQEGLSFPEAVRTVAGRYGIEIPDQAMSPDQKEQMTERETMLAINQEAAAYFQRNLYSSSGQKALEYLHHRGITQQTAEGFQIGCAPEGWDHLIRFFSKKQVPAPEIEKTGLIIPRKNGNGFYDRFRDRIIFPIFDVRTRVIGFGGRVLDDSLPKYLNSPETLLYNKSRSLYGLHKAKQKCRQTGAVFVTEGYLDVISLHQHGIENAVAVLGTALTSEHVRLLKRYAEKIVLVYDSDEAGVRAAVRSAEIFSKEQADVYVLALPSGYDPDSFIFEFGPDAFMGAYESALPLMSFLTEAAIKKHGLSVEGKLRVISDMTAPIVAVEDDIRRSLHIAELSGRIGIDERAVAEKIWMHRRIPASDTGRSFPVHTNGNRPEQQIIAIMLQFPDILDEIRQRNLLEFFEDHALKSVGQTILKHQAGTGIRVSDLITDIEDEEKANTIAFLASKSDVWDREGCLKLISQFESARSRRRNTLFEEIRAAEAENNYELVLELLKKKEIQARQVNLFTGGG
jgi:DNA primase